MGLLLAPRGRNGIAQGEALGKGQPRVPALKGRDIDFCFAAKRESTLRLSADSGGSVTPLQGFVGYRSSVPGLRPGLFHHALSGLRTDVLRAFCLHSAEVLQFFKTCGAPYAMPATRGADSTLPAREERQNHGWQNHGEETAAGRAGASTERLRSVSLKNSESP